MYYYNKAYVVRHPVDSDRYLVGVDCYVSLSHTLDNGRTISDRRFGFFKVMNPWGFKGASLEIIKNYYTDPKTVPEYDYSDWKHFTPLGLSRTKIGPEELESYPKGTVLKLSDISKTVLDACETPLEFSDKALFSFKNPDRALTWRYCCEMHHTFPFPESILSVGLVADNKAVKIIKRPYFVVRSYREDSQDFYLGNGAGREIFYTRTLVRAKKFPSEEIALNYICNNDEACPNGYSIEEIGPPRDINIILRAR